AEYADPSRLPSGTKAWISRFDVKNVQPAEDGDLSTVKVKAHLDLNSVLSITSAYTVVQTEVEEPVPQPEPKEGEEPKTPEMRKVKKLVKKDVLPVLQASQSLAPAAVAALTKKERDMHAADELVGATEVAKNSLEEYIYDVRGKVEGEYKSFVEPAAQAEFLAALNTAEDWLYEDGEDAARDAYVEKLAELKATGEPIAERHREDVARPKAVRELRDAIAHWADRATSQEERYAHITPEERQKILDRIEKVQEWLDDKTEKQSQKSKWDAPTVFASEIKKQREDLVYFASPVMSRPKPEPKPEESKPAEPVPAEAQPEAAQPAEPPMDMDID
ncbi:adenyl-nucleotide exchange factor sse1, partial [Coemansia helicoidea]